MWNRAAERDSDALDLVWQKIHEERKNAMEMTGSLFIRLSRRSFCVTHEARAKPQKTLVIGL